MNSIFSGNFGEKVLYFNFGNHSNLIPHCRTHFNLKYKITIVWVRGNGIKHTIRNLAILHKPRPKVRPKRFFTYSNYEY